MKTRTFAIHLLRMKRMKSWVWVALLFTLLLPVGSSCKKEHEQPQIPYVYVNFSINPNSTEHQGLNVVNGWETVTGGYRGIVLFRKSQDEFMAYERTCPNDPGEDGARISVEASGITAQCPVCGSKYILLDGSTYEGPSHYPLKQYQTNYDGSLLYVYN